MKQDSALDFLRDTAGRLLMDGVLTGYLTSSVRPFWDLGRLFRVQERVWITIDWTDGQRDEETEDYEPWVFLERLQTGWLDWDDEPHGPLQGDVHMLV